jgi:hypothetical protein
MPVNLSTHAHAQGLANLQFMIPELVQVVNYRKGSYYADLGDFSTLGAANISLYSTLPESIDHVGAGQYGWIRALTASTVDQWGGDLLYAADVSYFDDGWDTPQKNKRFKGLLKHTVGDDCEGWSTGGVKFEMPTGTVRGRIRWGFDSRGVYGDGRLRSPEPTGSATTLLVQSGDGQKGGEFLTRQARRLAIWRWRAVNKSVTF